MWINEGASERARAVRFVLLDADGVLTDGRIHMGPDGAEWKSFDARDGLGIRLAQSVGLGFGLISGRRSSAVERRVAELGFCEVHTAVSDKLGVAGELLARRGFELGEVAYIGDDLVDVPIMRQVGFAATVPDAGPEIRAVCHLVASRPGGRGAVREIMEYVLRAQGHWASILARYAAE